MKILSTVLKSLGTFAAGFVIGRATDSANVGSTRWRDTINQMISGSALSPHEKEVISAALSDPEFDAFCADKRNMAVLFPEDGSGPASNPGAQSSRIGRRVHQLFKVLADHDHSNDPDVVIPATHFKLMRAAFPESPGFGSEAYMDFLSYLRECDESDHKSYLKRITSAYLENPEAVVVALQAAMSMAGTNDEKRHYLLTRGLI